MKNEIKEKPYCMECDWECFRDPSEQPGYLLEIIKNPFRASKTKDEEYKRLWREDIKYYKKCDYFDGRKIYIK